MAAWRLRKVHNAASRFTGATPFANWRDEVDSLREAHKWDQALETYRRLAKDKDPSLCTLVLGQKARDEGDLVTARNEWSSLSEKGGGADDFPHYVSDLSTPRARERSSPDILFVPSSRKPKHY